MVGEIGRAGGEAVYLHQDVSLEESWPSVIEATERRFGQLDVMVANAGIGILCKAVEMSLSDWRRQTAVNLDGVFLEFSSHTTWGCCSSAASSVKYAVQRCGALAVAPSSSGHLLRASGDRQD